MRADNSAAGQRRDGQKGEAVCRRHYKMVDVEPTEETE